MADFVPDARVRVGDNNQWPSAFVAVALLILVGAVLVTATIRWSQDDVSRIIGAFTPILGIVTGAFVTYFFTKQASASAVSAAQTATESVKQAGTSAVAAAQTAAETAKSMADNASGQLGTMQSQLESNIIRSRALHNALTATLAGVNTRTAERLRQDPAVRAVLAPPE